MLQVGYRSNLKTSQSIQDLSYHGSFKEPRPKPVPRHRVVHQGNEIDSSTFTRKPRTNNSNNRPVSLNLSQLSVTPYKSGCKSMDASLTGSPVNENLSPTKSFVEPNKILVPIKLANRYKRYSCCFYVNINEKEVDVSRESKSVDDLSDVNKMCELYLGTNNESDPNEYSSDSLEECSEYGTKPRRCMSEYQILERSASAIGFKGSTRIERTKFHSEENILVDDNNGEGWERHSSASFFLRKNNTCRSAESILTDESEYQFLFSNREVFHSTESILTDTGDIKELPEDLDEIPQKQIVVRTRSLQDTTSKDLMAMQTSKSRPETPFEGAANGDWTQKPETEEVKNKNESFFIPFGDGPEKPTIPNALLKKHQSREEKKQSNVQTVDHPVVAHKPPKPKVNIANNRMNSQSKVNKFVASINMKQQVAAKNELNRNPFKNDILGSPVKDPGLNSISDLPQFNGGRVKLLSQNFERISAAREEFSCESGSSTPGTSSSCANSPKRRWKPSIGNQLARRIANGQILPDKCPTGILEMPHFLYELCVFIFVHI